MMTTPKTLVSACPGRSLACIVSLILTLASLFLARSALAASDPILESSYFEDPSGQRTLEEVRTLPFAPYRGILNKGYRRDTAYWLKLRIRPAPADAPPDVVRIRPAFINDLQLFDPADERPTPRVAGADHRWSLGELPWLNHGFVLRTTPEPRDIYLRVQTAHASLFEVRVQPQPLAEHQERGLEWAYIAYLCLAGITFVWALSRYLTRRDRLLGIFVANQCFVILWAIFHLGYGRFLLEGVLPAARIPQLTQTVILSMTLIGLYFYRTVLVQYPMSRLFTIPMNLSMGLPVIGLALFALEETTRALSVNAIGILVFGLTAALAVWFSIPPVHDLRAGQLPRWSLRLAYSLFLLIIASAQLTWLGWPLINEAPFYVGLSHGLLSTAVMGGFLLHRDRKLAELQIAELASARERAEQEQRARREQDQFMGMLNHELRTPLSVLKLLAADHPQRALAEDTIDDITRLLERCLLSDRLAHQRPAELQDFQTLDALSEALHKTKRSERFAVIEAQPHAIRSDPEFYAVMVGNLLDNALKYSPPGSEITVTLRRQPRDGREVSWLSVCNAIGRAGVPDLDRVFDKYYRAESAKAVSGTGLGLYLVKSFANLVGGDVDCVIEQERICFRLWLPR